MKRAANDQVRLEDLPLFATDRQIAQAIVGVEAAEDWLRDRLPTLAKKPGFPPIDPFHGGRPVWLVLRFYREYLHIRDDQATGRPGGVEGEWKRSKRQA